MGRKAKDSIAGMAVNGADSATKSGRRTSLPKRYDEDQLNSYLKRNVQEQPETKKKLVEISDAEQLRKIDARTKVEKVESTRSTIEVVTSDRHLRPRVHTGGIESKTAESSMSEVKKPHIPLNGEEFRKHKRRKTEENHRVLRTRILAEKKESEKTESYGAKKKLKEVREINDEVMSVRKLRSHIATEKIDARTVRGEEKADTLDKKTVTEKKKKRRSGSERKKVHPSKKRNLMEDREGLSGEEKREERIARIREELGTTTSLFLYSANDESGREQIARLLDKYLKPYKDSDEIRKEQALLALELIGAVCMQCKNPLNERNAWDRPCFCTRKEMKSKYDCDFSEEIMLDFQKYRKAAMNLSREQRIVQGKAMKEQLGREEFARRFPCYDNDFSSSPNHEYTRRFHQWQEAWIRYTFSIGAMPISVFDWTGTFDEKKIPTPTLTNLACHSERAEQAIKKKRARDPQYPIFEQTCSADCKCSDGNSAECSCAMKFKGYSYSRINRYGQLETGDGVGVAGIDDFVTKLSSFESEYPPIVSCVEECGCGPRCKQNLTRGCRFAMCLIYFPDCEWAITAGETIPRGTFVSTMAGETITGADESLRDKKMFCHRLFPLDYLTIACDHYKNDHCYASHSCAPNMFTIPVYHERDLLLPRLGNFTRQIVRTGEQLTWEYHSFGMPRTFSPCFCYTQHCVDPPK